MSLLLIVVVNIWGFKCDIKTDSVTLILLAERWFIQGHDIVCAHMYEIFVTFLSVNTLNCTVLHISMWC